MINSTVQGIISLQNQSKKATIFVRITQLSFDYVAETMTAFYEYFYQIEVQVEGMPTTQNVILLAGNKSFPFQDVNDMYYKAEPQLQGGITDKLSQAANLVMFQVLSTPPTPPESDNIFGVKSSEWELQF